MHARGRCTARRPGFGPARAPSTAAVASGRTLTGVALGRAARTLAWTLALSIAIDGTTGTASATTDGILASPGTVQIVRIEDFGNYPAGGFPSAWKVRGSRGDAAGIYRVTVGVESQHFLAARAEGSSVMIGLDHTFDPARYPYLRWRWRVRQLPTGGDERDGSTNDSAAGVYVIFPGMLPFTPRVLKYVWSTGAPVGTRGASPGYGNTKIIVLESGAPGESEAWRTAVVNVRDDYATLFGASPPAARGIGLLTDANDTSSVAAADYAAFELLSASPATGDAANTRAEAGGGTTIAH